MSSRRSIPEARLRFVIRCGHPGAERYLASTGRVPYRWCTKAQEAHAWLHKRSAEAFLEQHPSWQGTTPAGYFSVVAIERVPS